MPPLIELSSDTHSSPTPAMRAAMGAAEVGNEKLGEDPTVNRLVARVCELLGKPAGIFLPSGTMCNVIAMRVHCRPGDEVIVDRTCHLRNSESGGAAAIAGVMLTAVEGRRGVFDGEQLAAALRHDQKQGPRSRVVVMEQTSNLGGGTVWPLAAMQEVSALARKSHLIVHVDGARLFNAVVASGIQAREYAACADTIWVDFTKGLGAPFGAVLTGSETFIAEAWHVKRQLGGAMRQAGIMAAGALHALEHHIERLAVDHANARQLAAGLASIDGLRVEPVETNIVFFEVQGRHGTAREFADRAQAEGVRFSVSGATRLRAVTHLDVSAAMITEAVECVRRALSSLR